MLLTLEEGKKHAKKNAKHNQQKNQPKVHKSNYLPPHERTSNRPSKSDTKRWCSSVQSYKVGPQKKQL